tara:strand:- start:2367 stop:2876 length:510 start_codon:yes stop_codon:yes gene_type:complete
MAYYPAPAVANAFLERHGGMGRFTQMQLQKLTYFAHGWNLAVNGEPLVNEEFQAWDYGPVVPDLYDHTRFFGREPIRRPITDKDSNKVEFFLNQGRSGTPYRANLSAAELDVLNRVVARYGALDAFKMSELTHQPGTPWHRFYERGANRTIPNAVIADHYRELARIGGH